jgi:hypothetical protein
VAVVDGRAGRRHAADRGGATPLRRCWLAPALRADLPS